MNGVLYENSIFFYLFLILNTFFSLQENFLFALDEVPTPSPNVSFLIEKSKILHLSEQKQWRDLLHIRPNVFGLHRSQVTDKNFFLSKDGYKNPEAELEATLEAFFTKNDFPVNKHPLCFFPARKRWLSERLHIAESSFPVVQCKFYDAYIKNLNPESVSIVFSAYYPNNPGSVFGHTLFRINKKLEPYERPNELLDHGIGYAANANIDNPALYALYGLFGGFKGVFTNVPYYYKVREYNDFESRSLWSYDLNLTDDEVRLLVDHLWEVGFSYFDYYFFTQNCGFHMLTVLEAAAPRLQVTETISFWVIPSDAVKVIAKEPDFIKRISYRPSVEEKFYQRWNLLNENEKNQFRIWKNNNSLAGLENLNEESQKNILDTILDFFDYKNPNITNLEFQSLQKDRNNLLLKRAKILSVSPDLKITAPIQNRPDVGHESGRIGFRLGSSVQTQSVSNNSQSLNTSKSIVNYQELQIRFALHDLLDSSWSYPPGANIEFMNFRFRHWQKSALSLLNNKTQLEEFTLFRLISLFPRDEFHQSPSWNFSVTSKRVYDIHCDSCYAGGVEGGIGETWNIFDDRISLFTFLNSHLLYSEHFNESHWLWSLGPQAGVLFRWDEFSMKLILDTKWFLEQGLDKSQKLGSFPSQEIELRHNFSKNWSWGVSARNEKSTKNYEFQLYHFM